MWVKPHFSATSLIGSRFSGRDSSSWIASSRTGLIGGVIAAGAANAAAQQEAAAAQQHAPSCAQRYRSYDPASNTFAAKDGRRYLCQ
nr:BA14K family protein [Bradyrhizobium sp. 6(2017)]